MDRKDIHQQIIKLTKDEDWVKCSNTVAYVQQLSEMLTPQRIDYSKVRVAVKNLDGSEKVYSSIEKCVQYENLSKETIQRSIRRKTQVSDGRKFYIIE